MLALFTLMLSAATLGAYLRADGLAVVILGVTTIIFAFATYLRYEQREDEIREAMDRHPAGGRS